MTAAFVMARRGRARACGDQAATAPATAAAARIAAIESASCGRSATSRPSTASMPVRRVTIQPATATRLTHTRTQLARRSPRTNPTTAAAPWATARATNSRDSAGWSAWMPAAAAWSTAAAADAMAGIASRIGSCDGSVTVTSRPSAGGRSIVSIRWSLRTGGQWVQSASSTASASSGRQMIRSGSHGSRALKTIGVPSRRLTWRPAASATAAGAAESHWYMPPSCT